MSPYVPLALSVVALLIGVLNYRRGLVISLNQQVVALETQLYRITLTMREISRSLADTDMPEWSSSAINSTNVLIDLKDRVPGLARGAGLLWWVPGMGKLELELHSIGQATDELESVVELTHAAYARRDYDEFALGLSGIASRLGLLSDSA